MGVYLYGSDTSHSIFSKLKSIYDDVKFKRTTKFFEIVFVNLHFEEYGYRNEDSFNEAFQKMSWLALPFEDKTCRNLWFKYNRFSKLDESPEYGVLLIVSPCGRSVDPYGAKVLKEYDIRGYPFTREQAAQVEMEKVKHVQVLPKIMAYHGHLIRSSDQNKVLYNYDIICLEFI